MGAKCEALAKGRVPCKNQSIIGSRYCIWHVEKPPLILGAVVGVIIGYFVNWIFPTPELRELRALRTEVRPLVDLAETNFPNLQRAEAVEELAQEVDSLRRKVAKHEFIALDTELRQSLLRQLDPVAVLFDAEGIHVEISHETWINHATRAFTKQLASLLQEAGFNVSDPEFSTVYLATEVHALEWGFNPEQIEAANQLYQVVSRIVVRDRSHAKQQNFERGRLRLHFAGEAIFREDGTIELK